jgi:hypothetical protein
VTQSILRNTSFMQWLYVITVWGCDCRRDMDWLMDLLTTCVHVSELRLIIIPLLIFIIHRLPWHILSSFTACCIFNIRFLAMASNTWDSLGSLSHVVTVRLISRNWTMYQLNSSANYHQDISSARTIQKTHSLSCCRSLFTEPLNSKGRGADHTENTVLLILLSYILWSLPSSGSICCNVYCSMSTESQNREASGENRCYGMAWQIRTLLWHGSVNITWQLVAAVWCGQVSSPGFRDCETGAGTTQQTSKWEHLPVIICGTLPRACYRKL